MERILYILAIALSILACTDDIDKSNRFTFTGVPDEETEDNCVENDKQMRNRGWMKSPDSFYSFKYDGYVPARNAKGFLRRILTTKYLDSGEHWLRIKSLSDLPFVLDYIELVPLNVINDPLKPEDRH